MFSSARQWFVNKSEEASKYNETRPEGHEETKTNDGQLNEDAKEGLDEVYSEDNQSQFNDGQREFDQHSVCSTESERRLFSPGGGRLDYLRRALFKTSRLPATSEILASSDSGTIMEHEQSDTSGDDDDNFDPIEEEYQNVVGTRICSFPQ